VANTDLQGYHDGEFRQALFIDSNGDEQLVTSLDPGNNRSGLFTRL